MTHEKKPAPEQLTEHELKLKHDAHILKRILDLLECESEATKQRTLESAVRFFGVYIRSDV